MNKLPFARVRMLYSACILALSILGFFNRWLICRDSVWLAAVSFAIPLGIGGGFYWLEYHYRLLERLFTILQKGRVTITLTIFFTGVAFLLHYQDTFLGIYLPVCYLICVCAAEAEYAAFDACLSAISVQSAVFYSISLYVTYHAASALSIAILGYMAILRILTYRALGDREICKGVLVLTASFMFTSAFLTKILERLLLNAITPLDNQIYLACMELWETAKFYGPAAMTMHTAADLVPYSLGYLVAAYGWISILPVMLIVVLLLVFGIYLLRGLCRPMTTLAVGAYLLILLRIVSYLLKSLSITVGFGNGLPFFHPGVLDYILAVIVMQPLNPKPLLALTPKDPDFDAQELAALLLLPDDKDGAAQLAHYVFNTDNRVAWTMLLHQYREMYGPNDIRILLMNAAQIFGTQSYLRERYPEYYLLASGQDSPLIPQEIKTVCYDNTFLDMPYCESEGTTLLRYWGNRSTLLIGPFYTQFAAGAFYQNKQLETVCIPNMTQRLGTSCFQGCQNLRTVELREGLEEIGAFVFSQCPQLHNIILPDSLQRIEHDAFRDSGLLEITVSIALIPPYTFAHTPLKEVTLHNTEVIEAGAFKDCPNLQCVVVPDTLYDIAIDAFSGCTQVDEVIASAEWLALHPDLYNRIKTGGRI